MPVFQYEALDKTGKPQKGSIEAASSDEAMQRIKLQNLYPTAVQEQKSKKAGGKTKAKSASTKKKKKSGGITFGGVNAKQLTVFTRQLSTLQDAGLPLLRSLQILESQLKPGKLKNVLDDVCDDVEAGQSLSDAMARHPKVFNRLYTKMVNAGEIGGVLDVILQRLSEFMEKAQKLKSKIKGALIYPAVVISISVIILVGIMYFIIPQFEAIFTDFGIELPPLTMGLIGASRWMAGNSPGQSMPGAVIIIFSPLVFLILYRLIRKTPFGRAVTDWTFLRIPVFGSLIKKSTTARFTRTLGTLISAGVPILEAIKITAETSGSWVFERSLLKVHDSIREGESFAQPLRETKTCDAMVVNMIDVGEETGDMDSMLMKIADTYDYEVDIAVEAMVKLIEPLMVVVLGGMVGTIVVAMFMPMIKMIESLSG